jgi:hypothetical protein
MAVRGAPQAASPQAITAWSYARYRDWKKCAKFFYFKHVMKLKEPSSKAMERGSEIDKLASVFTMGKATDPCPPELAKFETEFRAVQKIPSRATQTEWAWNQQWHPVDWFAPDCWFRAKTDITWLDVKSNRANVVDVKTGKVSEAYGDQMEVYDLAGLLSYPKARDVVSDLWFLDHGVIMPQETKVTPMADLPKLKKKWEKNVAPMFADQAFKENPGNACTYCPFSKSKGGQCKY